MMGRDINELYYTVSVLCTVYRKIPSTTTVHFTDQTLFLIFFYDHINVNCTIDTYNKHITAT